MNWPTVRSQLEAIERGEVSALEIRDVGVDRCERLNPTLGFLAAELYDRAPAGVPMLLKDAGQEIAGTQHWAGVAALRDADSRSTRTTELAARFEHAGFSIIGKSACPPLANGVTTEPPGFAPTRNPWDLEASVGGSSGGAAAAVACGAVPIAHGSDATGSLRFPAALCGVVTLVPSMGVVKSIAPCGQPPSRMWRDFVLARDTDDLRFSLEILGGDRPAIGSVPRSRSAPSGRVGVLDHDPELGLTVDKACRDAVHVVARALTELGWDVEERWPSALNSLWHRIGGALGVRSDATRGPVIDWVADRLGRPPTDADLPAEVFEAAARDATRSAEDRTNAEAVIEAGVRPIDHWFNAHDLLITPATFRAGWLLGSDPGFAHCGTLAAPFSMTGQPSVVVPVPLESSRAPVGVQIVGRAGTDRGLLDLLAQLQPRLDWLAHRPGIIAGRSGRVRVPVQGWSDAEARRHRRHV